MPKQTGYSEELIRLRALLIVASLQLKHDLKALKALQNFREQLTWEPIANLMIDKEIWRYAVKTMKYDPKLVFCHPDVLTKIPYTSLYYRGLCALSMKAAKSYFGAIENVEKGKVKSRLDADKALKMARTYNTFICSIIKNSTSWTLKNGHRTIIATLGITLDGVMRNKVGEIAEQRVRTLIMEWVIDNNLLVQPKVTKDDIQDNLPSECTLNKNIRMKFHSDPDISFSFQDGETSHLLAIVEIKGGVDPAGALERYGAATKTFQNALQKSSHCKNFFLSAVYTPELERRIKDDRLVENYFDIVKILEVAKERKRFLEELFHFTLRLD
jgi:hypothetical protein